MSTEETPAERFLKAVAESPDQLEAMLAANRSLLFARYTWGGTALHYAVFEGWTAGVRRLLELGADANTWDDQDQTPLMSAIEMVELELIELLLKSGADLHARNTIGDTVLSQAIQRGDPRAVSLLLSAGATLEEMTPMDLSLMFPTDDRDAVVEVLRAHGWGGEFEEL